MNPTDTVQRLGVRKAFPKVPVYLRQYVKGIMTLEEAELPRLRRYVESGSFLFRFYAGSMERPYSPSTAMTDLVCVANVAKWEATQAALSGQADWMPVWVRSATLRYWCQRFEFLFEQRAYEEVLSGVRRQKLGMLFMHQVGPLIGHCLALGWLDWAVDLTRHTHWGLDHECFNDGGDDTHRRTHHFMVRLAGRWQGWPERSGPACAFDEPLFNALVEHWDTEDLALIESLLLAAADRHTHQARPDSNKGHFDLPWSGYTYDPFEILSVLRLRQLRGLPNPTLDHVLMNTPLGQLPSVQPIYTDELLEGMLARVRVEFPDL